MSTKKLLEAWKLGAKPEQLRELANQIMEEQKIKQQKIYGALLERIEELELACSNFPEGLTADEAANWTADIRENYAKLLTEYKAILQALNAVGFDDAMERINKLNAYWIKNEKQ